MSKIIPVVLITDNNYIYQSAVTIKSIINSQNNNTIIEINILGYKLTEDDKNYLLNIENDRIKIKITDVDDSSEFLKLNNHSDYSNMVLLKLYISDFFPQYEKMLYLDSDIIVNIDLEELYDINLEDNYFAGVQDIFVLLKNKQTNRKYINTGVLLINLRKIRENKISRILTENYIKNCKKYDFPEQDTINEVLNDYIMVLPLKYNFFALSKNVFYKWQLNKFYNVKTDYNGSKFIIHYANIRPWNDKTVPFADLWQDIAKTLPDNSYKIKIKKTNKIKNILRFFKYQTLFYLYILRNIKCK